MATAIAVNGTPLAEHLEGELTKEIQEVRSLENPLKGSRHVITKHNGNQSRAKSGKAFTPYMGDPKTTHIFACGVLAPVGEKAPFVRVGFSADGCVEFRDDTQEWLCFQCGDWVANLDMHVAQKAARKGTHVSWREHKIRQRLPLSRSIRTPKQTQERRALSVQAGLRPRSNLFATIHDRTKGAATRKAIGLPGWAVSPGKENMLGKCRAQTERDARALYEKLGRTPTMREYDEFRNRNDEATLQCDRLRRMYGSLQGFALCAGIPARKREHTPESRRRIADAVSSMWANMSASQKVERIQPMLAARSRASAASA